MNDEPPELTLKEFFDWKADTRPPFILQKYSTVMPPPKYPSVGEK